MSHVIVLMSCNNYCMPSIALVLASGLHEDIGSFAMIADPRPRYVTTFCYGCYLRPPQTSRSPPGVDRRQVAYVNHYHILEQKLLDALVGTALRQTVDENGFG
jgi:hypothetical protein